MVKIATVFVNIDEKLTILINILLFSQPLKYHFERKRCCTFYKSTPTPVSKSILA